MFCTRCGQAVGQTDRVCATCSNDLGRSGAIRLTDPATLGDTTAGPPAEWFRDVHKVREVASVGAQPSAPQPPPLPVPPTVATWRPPPPPHTQVTYPDVDYVPKPEPGGLRNSAVMIALVGLVALALILVVAVAIRFLRPAQNIVIVPSASSTPVAASSPPNTQTSEAEPTPGESETPTPSIGATMPVGVTECAPNVGAGRNTSCEFALNVAGEVDRVEPALKTATFQVTAKSPVTGQSYAMSCSPTTGMIVCVGGNSASVYLLNAP